jgi:hypothetical protein
VTIESDPRRDSPPDGRGARNVEAGSLMFPKLFPTCLSLGLTASERFAASTFETPVRPGAGATVRRVPHAWQTGFRISRLRIRAFGGATLERIRDRDDPERLPLQTAFVGEHAEEHPRHNVAHLSEPFAPGFLTLPHRTQLPGRWERAPHIVLRRPWSKRAAPNWKSTFAAPATTSNLTRQPVARADVRTGPGSSAVRSCRRVGRRLCMG